MPIFVDGFDHYTLAAEGSRKWDLSQLAGITPTGGRNNSGYVNLNSASSVRRKHFAATDHVICQYGIKATYAAGNVTLCQLESPIGGPCSSLLLLFDGSIRYSRGATALFTTPGGTLSGGVWHYIEIEQTLSIGGATTGTCVVKLNGDTIINLSGINNNDDAGEYPTMVSLVGSSSTALAIDDFVLVTGSEAAPFNTLFGDWAVRTLYVNGAGSSTQFTPLSGTNFSNVDDTTPDDDTTYVESATVGQRDLYTMTDLPASVVSVLGVVTTPTIRKSDAGTRQFANVISRAATPAVGATLTCTSAYSAGLQTMFRFDPVTGVAPTPAQVNAYEAGYEVVT